MLIREKNAIYQKKFWAGSAGQKLVSRSFIVFSIAFVATFVASSVFAPTISSDAATINTSVSSAGYYIDIASNDVNLELETSVSAETSFTKDTILTKTNSPSGYKLYLSMENSKDCNKTTGLCDGTGTGDNFVPGNALYQDGDSTSGIFISPTAGTLSVPDTLTLNSWGVSTAEITTGDEATFWAVPLLSSPQLIQTTSGANTTGVEKDLYFGARANFSLPAGEYSNTIVYTAAANANTSGNPEFAIAPSLAANGLSGGETVTITTTLYTNYPLLSTSDATVTIGGNTCAVTSIYTNATTGTIELKCTTPSSTTAGLKDVVVNISPFDWSSTLKSGYNYGDFWTITYMQEMTPSICNTVFTPSNVTGSSALLKTSRAEYTATTSGTAQVAQRTLYDYRGIDGTGTASNPATGSNMVSYTIRKLADGNCWMSENLKLTLSTSHAYEVATFSGGTTTWTPNQDLTSTDPYNIAISQNTKANISVNGRNEWYYPWYAATAGQGTNAANPTINRSICPKGWRLPNGGDNPAPSFASLITTAYGIDNSSAGSTKLQGFPLSFYCAGRYSSGRPQATSSSGSYWSASPYASNGSSAYNLFFSNSVADTQNVYGRYNGYPVRCVAMP